MAVDVDAFMRVSKAVAAGVMGVDEGLRTLEVLDDGTDPPDTPQRAAARQRAVEAVKRQAEQR